MLTVKLILITIMKTLIVFRITSKTVPLLEKITLSGSILNVPVKKCLQIKAVKVSVIIIVLYFSSERLFISEGNEFFAFVALRSPHEYIFHIS